MSNLPPLPEGEVKSCTGDRWNEVAVEYFTADQMRAFAEEAVRLEREAKARAEQDEIVNAAIEWYGSSHKDEPEHRLAMAVLRFKTAIARSQEGQG